jgi:hypothetical protein
MEGARIGSIEIRNGMVDHQDQISKCLAINVNEFIAVGRTLFNSTSSHPAW